jgi:hypothetical protein
MWNETVVAWHDILQKVRKATILQKHSYSERVELRIPRIEEQNINNNKENVTDVHKNITVYSVIWYWCAKFQRCPLPPSACIYPNDGASMHVITFLVATQKKKIRLYMSVSHSVFRLTFLVYVMFSLSPSWERPVSHIVHQNFQNHCLLQIIGRYKPAMRRFPEDIYEIVKTDMTAFHMQASGTLSIGPTRQAMCVST